MLGLFKVLFLINLNYVIIESSIDPELSVSKFDKNLIERKRQNTMDMCRIFTEETKKLETINKISKRHDRQNTHRRVKRNLQMNSVNPALNAEDAARVEKIVDKMYDDLFEQGVKVNYRRGDVPTITTKKNVTNKSNSTQFADRRFFFAPGVLLGPLSTAAPKDKKHVDIDDLVPDGREPRFKQGIVPYFIDSRTYDSHLAQVITKAFDYFEKATCIRLQRLRERPTDRESLRNVIWLYITNPSGIKQCVHSNDRAEIKGVQMIVFGYDCMSLGDITHEIMHVLGFAHEHLRPDRDQYITVMWDNIKPGYKKYFELLKQPLIENMPYDYASVLHYPPRAFSRNGQVTIMTQPGVKIGQREGLSELDVEKISTLYSGECVKRNREYLLKTCPSVVKAKPKPVNTTKTEIDEYYRNRIWSYGIVNYKLRDSMEFSQEERDNIKAVIHHIEKETCIEFRDLTPDDAASEETSADDSKADGDTKNEDGKDKKKSDEEETDKKKSEASSEEKSSEKDNKKNSSEQDSNENSSEESDNEIKSDEGDASRSDLIIKLTSDDDPEQSFRSSKVYLRKKKSILKDATRSKKEIHENDKKKNTKKDSRQPVSPSRRHATNIIVFTRSATPGCACPKTNGAPGAVSTVEINADCFNSVNLLLHLFVHLLGLDHQHNSHDRDSYLHIIWDQLTDDVKKEMKEKLPPAASVGFPYDYQSVMHYPWLQIKNGRTNIMYPIWNDGWAMGHWQGLSSIDVQKLNVLYYKQCMLRKEQADQAAKIRKE